MIKSNIKYKLYIASSALLVNALFAGSLQPEERSFNQTVVSDKSYMHPNLFLDSLDASNRITNEEVVFRFRPMSLEKILEAEKFSLFLGEPQTALSLVENDIQSISTLNTTQPIIDFNQGFFPEENLPDPAFYISGGETFLPFGKFENTMMTPTLTQRLGRTRSTPLILGYKTPEDSGFFGEVYTFRSNVGEQTGVLGAQGSYILKKGNVTANIGASYIGSIADSMGMQDTGAAPSKTFGGFGSALHGSQAIQTIPAVSIHGNFSINHYKLIAEYLTAAKAFRDSDLSFNGRGATPKAAQIEAGMDFLAFSKPASLSFGYQWSDETLALNFPHHRLCSIFNISLWENTIESFEFRHDIDFSANQFANGIAPLGQMNQTKVASGRGLDTIVAQVKFSFN